MNPLEKDFVPYIESLELKEVGFNEPCFGLYHNDKTFYPTQCKSHEQFHGQICSAPTFSQAFRWFREKHHLIGGVEYIGGATPSTTWWDIYVVGHFNTNTSKMTMKYQPYEEAELACLRKLIEIVKNKQK